MRAASQLTAEDTDPKLLTESASSSSLESGDLDGVSGCEAGVVGRELNWDDEDAVDTARKLGLLLTWWWLRKLWLWK